MQKKCINVDIRTLTYICISEHTHTHTRTYIYIYIYIYQNITSSRTHQNTCSYVFTNPSARAGCDIRSIFKRSLN